MCDVWKPVSDDVGTADEAPWTGRTRRLEDGSRVHSFHVKKGIDGLALKGLR